MTNVPTFLHKAVRLKGPLPLPQTIEAEMTPAPYLPPHAIQVEFHHVLATWVVHRVTIPVLRVDNTAKRKTQNARTCIFNHSNIYLDQSASNMI